MSAVNTGWADPQLGSLYAIIERKQQDFSARQTEYWCLSEALKQIEQADEMIERRLKDEAA